MKKAIAKNWKFMICVLAIFVLLLPMVFTIFYSLPSADDFSMAYGSARGTLFMDGVRRANNMFMNWSGLWPYMFIEIILNPMQYFELESYGIGVEMILLFLAFIIAVCSLINTAARNILEVDRKEYIALYIFIFLFTFLNSNIYKEIFYWFVGSSYMMAMTLGLVNINLTIKYFLKDENMYTSKIRGGGVILTGILACNFFQVAILPGMIYMVLWSCSCIKKKKILWKKAIPFGFMLASGLIAIAAPGNYARHSNYDSSLNILKALVDSCKMFLVILKHLVQQPLTIVLFVVCIYIGGKCTKKKVGMNCPLISAILSMMTLFVNAFPIALGYAGVDLPNRVYFVLDFTALVGMIVFAVSLGMYLRSLTWVQSFQPYHAEVLLAAFVVAILYSTLVYNQNISKLPWCQTAAGMKEVKEIHDVWQGCLISIRDSEESNVEVEVDSKYTESPILSLPRLSNNEEHWINRAIARYYGKETVKLTEKKE